VTSGATPSEGLLPVTLAVEDPDALAARYYPNGRTGGLTVDGPAPGVLGQRVELRVVVQKPAREFVVEGQLAWARHRPGPGQPAGFGVDFRLDDDRARVRLLAFARREVTSDATRVERRYQVALAVKVKHRGTLRREQVADLSLHGAFIRTWNPPAIGEQVELALRPPLSLTSLELKGTVAWTRHTGDHAGMGVEFALEAPQRERLAKLLTRLDR
jgi:Tfp pilus assembly protein PilZ